MEEIKIEETTPVWDAESRTAIDDLLDKAESYLQALRQKLPADTQTVAKGLLEKFPEAIPEDIKERQMFCEMIAEELVRQFDEKMLGGFSKETLKKTHDEQLCIPCFVQRPAEYPLYRAHLTFPHLIFTKSATILGKWSKFTRQYCKRFL